VRITEGLLTQEHEGLDDPLHLGEKIPNVYAGVVRPVPERGTRTVLAVIVVVVTVAVVVVADTRLVVRRKHR
jgi:hypothetical protein